MTNATHQIRRAALVIVFLLGSGFARAAEANLTLMWDYNDEPDVNGYLVFIGTQSRVYTQTIDVQHTDRYVFANAQPGQRYYFAVAAYAGELMSPLSIEVSGFSDAYPTLANPGNQTSVVGQVISLQLNGSDPYGDALTYTASGLPPGLMISQSLGVISGITTAAGTFTVTATVSDGTLTASRGFAWTVQSGTNQPAPSGPEQPGSGPAPGSSPDTSSPDTSAPDASSPDTSGAVARTTSERSVYTGTTAASRTVVSESAPATSRTLTGTSALGRVVSEPAPQSGPERTSFTGTAALTRAVASAETATSSTQSYTGTAALIRQPTGDGLSGGALATSGTRSIAGSSSLTGTQALVDPEESLEAGVAPVKALATGQAPAVIIQTPVDHASFAAGGAVIFAGAAHDAEEGDLAGRIQWTSSLQGLLGRGGVVQAVVQVGTHIVTASVTDAQGNTSGAQVTILVGP